MLITKQVIWRARHWQNPNLTFSLLYSRILCALACFASFISIHSLIFKLIVDLYKFEYSQTTRNPDYSVFLKPNMSCNRMHWAYFFSGSQTAFYCFVYCVVL